MRLPNDIIVHYEERADGTGIEGHYAGELIRCRECKYYEGDGHYCDYDRYAINNGYCYCAEKREPNTHER